MIHEYGEPLDAEMNVYALEEIVAEMLRAVLQHAEMLEHRGWSRSRARDYYDCGACSRRITTRCSSTASEHS